MFNLSSAFPTMCMPNSIALFEITRVFWLQGRVKPQAAACAADSSAEPIEWSKFSYIAKLS